MNKKLHLLIGVNFAVGLLLLGALSAKAQEVPVSLASPLGGAGILTSGGGYCLSESGKGVTSGSNVPVGDVDDTTPVGVRVWDNGYDYGVRGSYTATAPNCSSLPASIPQALCQSISTAFTDAVSAANAQTGFPQGTMAPAGSGYGGNSVSLQFGTGVCGIRNGNAVPLCETQVFTDAADGGADLFTYIYFDADSLNNPTQAQQVVTNGSFEFSALSFESNSIFAECDLAHELTHAFGLADLYNDDVTYPGLMGSECSDIFNGDSRLVDDNTPAGASQPDFWSANEATTVAWLNAGKPVVINSKNSCQYSCPAGQIATYSQTAKGNPYTVTCTSASAVPDQVSCNCNPPDGTAPYCTNLATMQTVAPPTSNFCAMQNEVDCTCNSSDQPICYNGNGETASAPQRFSCDAPAGATCECAYADSTAISVSCTATNGTDIPVPSDFSCSSPPPTTGGYICSEDNQCVYDTNPPAGTFVYGADSTCNNACLSAIEPPTLSGYSCDESGSCEPVYSPSSAEYTTSDCDNSCTSNY